MNNFETKVDELGVLELKAYPIDLKKLSDVVNKEGVKKAIITNWTRK